MSTASGPSPFCRWVIARDYYDGMVSGIGLRSRDNQPVFFRVVAWDTEGWERIFAVTPVSQSTVEHFRALLSQCETQKEPFWLIPAAAATADVSAAWDGLRRAALANHDWQLAEGHDLLEIVHTIGLDSFDARRVAELVRQEAVIDLGTPPLVDEFLRRIRRRLSSEITDMSDDSPLRIVDLNWPPQTIRTFCEQNDNWMLELGPHLTSGDLESLYQRQLTVPDPYVGLIAEIAGDDRTPGQVLADIWNRFGDSLEVASSLATNPEVPDEILQHLLGHEEDTVREHADYTIRARRARKP